MVDESEETPEVGSVTYLPHRAVVNEGKSSTRVRVVYDVSAKAGDCSLTECLYKGMCLLTPLIFGSWLIRFRLDDVAMVTNIESAYLQTAVTPEHRDFLRFLWPRVSVTIQKYRLARVIFGAAPSQRGMAS